MNTYKRRCKRILKQYGKHINAFDHRLDNPKDDSFIRKIHEKHEIDYERRIELSWFAKRTQNITCYEDLVNFATKNNN